MNSSLRYRDTVKTLVCDKLLTMVKLLKSKHGYSEQINTNVNIYAIICTAREDTCTTIHVHVGAIPQYILHD